MLFAGPLPSAVAVPPTARTVAGQEFPAEVMSVDDAWNITFNSGDLVHMVNAAELVAWSNPAEARRGPQVFTTDGGLLIGEVAIIADEQLVVLTDLVGTVRVPLDRVRGVLFQPPENRQQRDRMAERVRRAAGDTDRLILANGDELTGTVLGLADLNIRLETEAGVAQIEVGKVAALILNPTLLARDDTGGLRALVGLSDGSRLVATSLVVSDETALAELALGAKVEFSAPDDIVSLRPFGGQVTYLSDLAERRFRHVPYLELAWPFHKDRNVLGGQLRVGGRLFDKGLGMHSAARLTYRLDGLYRRFEAELAIDESAGRQGSVIFRVFTTDGETWQEAYTSPIVRGGDEPLPMSVDLEGTQAIALVVDFADRSDQSDHANWLSARLIQ